MTVISFFFTFWTKNFDFLFFDSDHLETYNAPIGPPEAEIIHSHSIQLLIWVSQESQWVMSGSASSHVYTKLPQLQIERPLPSPHLWAWAAIRILFIKNLYKSKLSAKDFSNFFWQISTSHCKQYLTDIRGSKTPKCVSLRQLWSTVEAAHRHIM